MFEERFGRRLTTLLLGLIGVALMVFTGGIILRGLIIPTIDFVRSVILEHQTVANFTLGYLKGSNFESIFMYLFLMFMVWRLFHDYPKDKFNRLISRKTTPLFEKVRILFWIKRNPDAAKKLLADLEAGGERGDKNLLTETVNDLFAALKLPDAKDQIAPPLPIQAPLEPPKRN